MEIRSLHQPFFVSNELEVYFLKHITVLSKKIDIINMTYR